ncbi:hypothetical protein ABEB36_009718 [Hypothenemus hampei]|uniref:6-phosphogluconolactonase n=1 Tax=Hypothenemus hampei TaxID=57062 RepID=A0ABD1EH87_HYPHA
MSIKVVDNKDSLITDLAKLIETTAKESICERGFFNVGVSGGSLAPFLVSGLPKIQTDFSKWRVFFCDERIVSYDNTDSTYGLYLQKLIVPEVVALKQEQFIPIKLGLTPEETAQAYEEELRKYVPLNNSLPQFDLLLLGMGPDGHTCSLFPGHDLLQETRKWVAPIKDSPKPPPERVTLTLPVVNNARVCAFAVAGIEKSDIIKKILLDKEDLPATRVQPSSGKLYWIVEKDAASKLNM